MFGKCKCKCDWKEMYNVIIPAFRELTDRVYRVEKLAVDLGYEWNGTSWKKVKRKGGKNGRR